MVGGEEQKAHLFALDLPHSDDCFVMAFPAETTEAFLEGHIQAFAYFGGVAGLLRPPATAAGTSPEAAAAAGFTPPLTYALRPLIIRRLPRFVRVVKLHVLKTIENMSCCRRICTTSYDGGSVLSYCGPNPATTTEIPRCSCGGERIRSSGPTVPR